MATRIVVHLKILLFIAWVIGGSLAMSFDAMAEEARLLSARPLTPEETDRTLYLYSEDMTLGTSARKKIIEGVVRTGRYHVIPLAARPDLGIKPSEWNLYLIDLPFTLDKAPGERNYERLVFRIRLSDDAITAYDLFPPSVTEDHKGSLKFGLTPKLKFQWFDIGADLSYQNEFEVLKPKITTYDVGRSEFRWEYEGTVLPGTKWALIVIEVPKQVARVTGEIQATAVVEKGVGDLLRKVQTLSVSEPIEWVLR